MPAKLDRCVQHVMAQGFTEQQAWAICVSKLGKDDVDAPITKDDIDELNKTMSLLSNINKDKGIESGPYYIEKAYGAISFNDLCVDSKMLMKSMPSMVIDIMEKTNDEDRTFWAVLTSDCVDKQGDKVRATATEKAMPVFLKRGVLIYGHKNLVVGRPIDWAQKKDSKGITKTYVKFKVYDDLPTDHAFWEDIKNGRIQKFSIGGVSLNERKVCKRDPSTGLEQCFNDVIEMGLFEASGLPLSKAPANDDAGIVAGTITKAMEYNCECLECGHKMTSPTHCMDTKCPKCGGTMRRIDRPGIGKQEDEQEPLGQRTHPLSPFDEADFIALSDDELQEEFNRMEKAGLPFKLCVQQRMAEGYSKKGSERICGAIKKRTIHHAMEYGMANTAESAVNYVTEKIKSDKLFAYTINKWQMTNELLMTAVSALKELGVTDINNLRKARQDEIGRGKWEGGEYKPSPEYEREKERRDKLYEKYGEDKGRRLLDIAGRAVIDIVEGKGESSKDKTRDKERLENKYGKAIASEIISIMGLDDALKLLPKLEANKNELSNKGEYMTEEKEKQEAPTEEQASETEKKSDDAMGISDLLKQNNELLTALGAKLEQLLASKQEGENEEKKPEDEEKKPKDEMAPESEDEEKKKPMDEEKSELPEKVKQEMEDLKKQNSELRNSITAIRKDMDTFIDKTVTVEAPAPKSKPKPIKKEQAKGSLESMFSTDPAMIKKEFGEE